ncbi:MULTISPECIES: class A beta-lactamase [Rhodopseudomonas]|uniref:Beta-lactamase n=1 Tax=Rhodopseudomonas palustris TaxID=1076 RepID=A0A0D7EIM5_RHOPL|nr:MULTISPECIES: class A beta-lactamase [Rhodopseudomonas]KIZ39342.1 beta-lactamase [Rhodopseudomonas palustris]MDF3812663.1 class A beta-lactamase [Rhodopseudomonas sp. BAL398]WOK18928.1 class A beta-lactamase [Rhodopseudomonas sp. BAL398]
MITRRCFTINTSLAFIGLGLGAQMPASRAATGTTEGFGAAMKRIEASSGGRLGVAVLDSASGARMGYRDNEAFPMCSTFKVLAAGAVLTQVDAGHARLSDRVRFTRDAVVTYSPITKDRIGGEGMTLAELCDAAIRYSDNTAGNLLLGQIGGPPGLTQFARTLGDPVTRLDRTETDLNEAGPGDPRDTTTPAAMLSNLKNLVLGSALSESSRDQLVAWLKGNTTGGTRLRAGLPTDWVVGDKTGSGGRGSTNDIAVIWPAERKPIVVTAYLTGTEAPAEQRNAALASVGRAVVAAVTG